MSSGNIDVLLLWVPPFQKIGNSVLGNRVYDILPNIPKDINVNLPSLPSPSFGNRINGYMNKWEASSIGGLNTIIGAAADFAGGLINHDSLSTGAGNIMSSIGNVVGNIPGPIGWAGKGLALAGLAVNALWGHKFNDANIAAAEGVNAQRNQWLFGDYSNTDALLAGSQSNVQLSDVNKGFIGKEGPFSNAVTNKMKLINNDRMMANLRANNSELNAYNNYLVSNIRNAIANDTIGSVNMAAAGGSLMLRRGLLSPFGNRFDYGGGVNTPFTHGSLFSNGLVQINNGGSHELNPNQGVLFGMDEMGIPNLVEEGETIFNAGAYGGPDSYSFSDRIEFPMEEYGEMFALGGRTKRMKGKRAKSYTFADVSKLLSKESEERPNDEKSLRTLAENLGKLAMVLEEVKARDMLELMNPLDIVTALLQSPMGELMVGDTLQTMDLLAMEQEPVMAAYGGNLYKRGGRTRRKGRRRSASIQKDANGNIIPIPIYEGNFGTAFSAARNNGNTIFEWNGKTYNTRLRGESDDAYNKYITSKLLPILAAQLNRNNPAEADRILNDYAIPEIAEPSITPVTPTELALPSEPIVPQYEYSVPDYNLNPLIRPSSNIDENGWLLVYNNFGRSPFGVNMFADGGGITNGLYLNGNITQEFPATTQIHGLLFDAAIDDWVKGEYDKYIQLELKGKYLDAYNVAQALNNNIRLVNTYYLNAMRDPSTENIALLLDLFEDLLLNKNVKTVLKTKNENGVYPVQRKVGRKWKNYIVDNPKDHKNGVITLNRFLRFTDDAKQWLTNMGINITPYSGFTDNTWMLEHSMRPVTELDFQHYRDLLMSNIGSINTNGVIRNPNYKEGSSKEEEKDEFIPISKDILQYAPEDKKENPQEWWNSLSDDEKTVEIAKHYNTTNDGIIRTGVYENRLVYEPIDRPYPEISEASESSSSSSSSEETGNSSTKENSDKDKTYFVPKPRNDWESKAALGVALGDYVDAMFGNGRTFQSPGTNAAYDYLSRVGNIPMVRNTPTGTKITYRPVDLNYAINDITNNTFGTIRTLNNLNQGLATANTIAAMNAGRDAISKARAQAIDDNLKILQSVLANNNQVDQSNSQNSLTALSTNAQNLARAREALATGAAQLAGTLSQSYNNWLNYRNTQSSGLALMLYDLGYNKQMLNLRDAAFLLNNQQPDVLNTAGIQYQVYNPALQQGNYPYIVVQTDNKNK